MRSPLEKVTKASGAATAAFALWLAASSIFLPSPTLRAESERYQYTPEPLEFPVKNPLYGWRGRRETPSYAKPPLNIFPADPEFESLKKWYIGWSEIEEKPKVSVPCGSGTCLLSFTKVPVPGFPPHQNCLAPKLFGAGTVIQ